jgi:DNA-binding MarR family transcriptional regulator
MRETLRQLDLKITELADYLKISRPTMYKYIDSFETRDYKSIDAPVLKLFQYIEKNKGLIGKRNVVNYILTNIVAVDDHVQTKESALSDEVASFIRANGSEDIKSQMIKNIIETKDYDKIIPYLVDIQALLSKKDLTEEEYAKLEPIIGIYALQGISIKIKKPTSGGK